MLTAILFLWDFKNLIGSWVFYPFWDVFQYFSKIIRDFIKYIDKNKRAFERSVQKISRRKCFFKFFPWLCLNHNIYSKANKSMLISGNVYLDVAMRYALRWSTKITVSTFNNLICVLYSLFFKEAIYLSKLWYKSTVPPSINDVCTIFCFGSIGLISIKP